MSYDYLPGTQVVTVDGGLAAKRVPQSKSTIILGVAGDGPANEAYQVVDRSAAAQAFGYSGNLIQAMEEVAQGGCDNIYLFRLGTDPAVLSGIGAVTTVGNPDATPTPIPDVPLSAGYSVTFGAINAGVGTDYRLYYDAAGILKVFYQGNLVYSNDPTDPVDTSDVTVDGSINTTHKGQAMLTGTTTDAAFDQSITLTAAAALTGGTKGIAGTFWNIAPTFVAADLGLTLDNCGLYEAQQLAFELIEIFPIQRVFCPGARFDAPNVAYNDSTAAGALGWLKTFEDVNGDTQFQWAHKTADSAGTVVTVQTFLSHTARLAAGFHEVHFPYQLARFCRKQSQNQGGCFGYIGFNPPVSYKAVGLKKWIGYLPVWGATSSDANAVLTAGKGLCGVPLLVGTTSDKLNSLVADIETKAYRSPGMFQTASEAFPGEDGEYDEGPIVDRNNYPVDVGAHIHAVGEWAYVMNAAGTYQGNLAGVVCGYESNLDPKSAITNKAMPAVAQIYRVTLSQLNSLTKAKVNMLRFKGDGVAPALLHDYTCSTDQSDYIFILRQNIKFLLCAALFAEADKFIGESSTDGLQLASLRTALDARITDLTKCGYIASCDYTIYSTLADRRIGRAFIDMTFNPPDEAVQIRASIAVGR